MGAIVPQRRISKTRKRLRRSHFKLDNPSMMVCPNCGEVKLAHTVCGNCGFYDGKLVKEVKVKEEAAEQVTEKVEKKAKKTTKKVAEEKAETETKTVKKSTKAATKAENETK